MLSIRKAEIEDALAIASIGTQTFLESHGHSGPELDINAYISKTYDVKIIADDLEKADSITHLIYLDDKPIGFSRIAFNSPHPLIADARSTKLDRIYILREFYETKAGAALFNFIIDLSKEHQQTGIWLYVWINNHRAIAFYKKNGFRIIGSADFQISPTHANPNHIMYLEYA